MVTCFDTGLPPSNVPKCKTLVLPTPANTYALHMENSHIDTNHDYGMLFNLNTTHVSAILLSITNNT